jgi:hypothetical protein
MLFEVSAASASHPQPSPECSSSIRHRHGQRHSLTRSIQTGSDDSPGRFSVCLPHHRLRPSESVGVLCGPQKESRGRGYDEMRAALQLHMTAPSSPLSHSASDLHLPEFFISLQSVVPMQAHLTPSPGVWKQSNPARAPTLTVSDAIKRVRTRRAARISPLHLTARFSRF